MHINIYLYLVFSGFLIKDTIPSRITEGRSEDPGSDNEESTTGTPTGTETSNNGMPFNRVDSKRVIYMYVVYFYCVQLRASFVDDKQYITNIFTIVLPFS